MFDPYGSLCYCCQHDTILKSIYKLISVPIYAYRTQRTTTSCYTKLLRVHIASHTST